MILDQIFELVNIIMIKKLLRINFHPITSFRNQDTIYALASGVNTAISIVRVGGQSAYRSLQLLQKNNKNQQIINQKFRQNYLKQHKIQSHHAHYKTIYNSQGNIIDKCLLLYFPPQHSYNNQEIIQFHVHGSKAIISSLFKQFKQRGFRMADRGQFTKRALLNDKINLIQAESINDLIRSQSQFQRQIAINNMLGKSKDFLDGVKKQLVKCLANNQAFIDFQDDQVQKDVRADLFTSNQQKVKELIISVKKILQNYKNLQILKQGINLTIIGKPNAGKSTLINSLSQKQVAIVSDQPGTTRDILHTQIQCGGILLNLYDTAGMRDTKNKIQVQGIRRAKMKIKQSQINLLMIDLDQEELKEHIGSNGTKKIEIINKFYHQGNKLSKKEIEHKEQTEQIYNYNELIDQNTMIVINKSDKLSTDKKENIKYFIRVNKKIHKQTQSQFSQPQQSQNVQQDQYQSLQIPVSLLISAEESKEVNKLLALLQQNIQSKYSLYKTSQQIYFTRQRYFIKLEKCVQYLQKYTEESRPDIACEYLRVSINEISQIFGKVDVEDMLDVLFAQFCIGK